MCSVCWWPGCGGSVGRGSRGESLALPWVPREGGMFSPLVPLGIGMVGSRGVSGLEGLRPQPALQPRSGWALRTGWPHWEAAVLDAGCWAVLRL